jgi:predicted Zn-dependent peptidase
MLVTHQVSALESLGGFGGIADKLNRYNQYVNDPGYLAQDLARYDAVQPSQVQTQAQQLLDSNQRVVVVTVPKS